MRSFLLMAALLSFVAPLRAQNAPRIVPPLTTSTASFSAQGMFPFVLPPLDDAPNTFDLSYLNPKPAGAAGFVRVEGEHFVDGAGQKLRLWGVNLNFEGTFPDKVRAPKIAGRLAKFGFNSVRLHQFDGNAAPRGLWKAGAIGSTRLKMPREIDLEQLDKLDFFVAELIKRGIYINFNLHVARKLTDTEGIVNANYLPDKDKGMAAIDARFAVQNKEFARFLLSHLNPYTGRTYAEEPGVCAVEVDNESSILALWLDGTLAKLPQPYAETLRANWNDWLTRKYPSEAAQRRAWTEINAPLSGPELLVPGGARPVFNPEPTPLPDPNEPTILDGPADLLPDGTVAPPLQAAPPASAVSPEARAILDAWKLNLAGGATGTILRDDLGGPSVDGFVEPGLGVNLTRAGSVSWAFQLVRDGLSLEDNKPYTFSFWARSSAPRGVSVNLWQDFAPYPWLGYTGSAVVSGEWQNFSFTMRSSGAAPGRVRLALNLANAPGALQFGGFSLRRGGRVSVPDAWDLHGGVPLPDAKAEPIFAVRRDFARYLGELEAKNVAEMRRFLRTDLGVKVPIWHTQAQFGGWGGVERETQSDAIDNHIYWKHPDFGGTGWNGGNWRVENQSMAATPLGDPLAAYAMLRVPGKPFVVSEFNSGQPNDFGAESLPMLAAFAAWQDWAGAWIFDYHSSGDYERDRFENFFSIDTQPVKMATAPLAALLFRRPGGPDSLKNSQEIGDIAPATTQTTLNLPLETRWSEVANTPGVPAMAVFLKTWNEAGAARGVALNGRAAVSDAPGLFASPAVASSAVPERFESDSGQLSWDVMKGVWKVNTPRSRVVAGYVGGEKIELDEAQFWVAPSSQWATIGLSSLDGAPIPASKRLLLTLAGRAENVGMKWNADRSSVGQTWGVGPTYVAGISSVVKLLTPLSNARVWALDERGARRGQLASSWQNGALKFSVSPVWRTLWYEIELS